MESIKIRFGNADEVWKFVNTIRRFNGEYDLAAGSYTVDAKSILGIFSIDLSKPIRMTIYSDECDDLLRELDDYIVKEEPEQEQQ